MGKVTFQDLNNNVLASSVLPDGFKTSGTVNVENQQTQPNVIKLSS